MRGIVDQPAGQHRGHLVNAVGKKEAAIEDRDFCLCERHKRTVDVSDLVQARSPVGCEARCCTLYASSSPSSLRGASRRSNPDFLCSLVDCFACARNDEPPGLMRENLRQELLRAVAAGLAEE